MYTTLVYKKDTGEEIPVVIDGAYAWLSLEAAARLMEIRPSTVKTHVRCLLALKELYPADTVRKVPAEETYYYRCDLLIDVARKLHSLLMSAFRVWLDHAMAEVRGREV